MNTTALVRQFHEAFKHPVSDVIDISNKKSLQKRIDWIRLELIEMEEALAANDPIEFFDGLLDVQYFLDGGFVETGFAKYKDVGMIEVHRSNMSKIPKDGIILYHQDGKVKKPDTFSPPDLKLMIEMFDHFDKEGICSETK